MTLLAPILGRRPQTETLHEEVFTESLADKIDREKGIIRDVKILGRSSANEGGQREYSPQAIAEAARFYEGKEVNLNHPDKSQASRTRPLHDGWGELRNIRHDSEGARGDLHYLKEHSETPVILERIERGMSIGLSHNADGRVVSRSGRRIVESVGKVFSVDLVTRPATNKTLFESEERTVSHTIKSIVAAHKAALPKGYEKLFEDAAADPVMGEIAVEAPPEASSDDQIKAAFRAMVVAAFDDEQLDSGATIARIKDILQAQEKLAGGTVVDTKNEPPAEPKSDPTQESLQEEVRRLNHCNVLRDVMEEHGLTRGQLGRDKVKLLESQATAADMHSLIKTWPPSVRGAQPPRGDITPLRESKEASLPKTTAGIRSFLRA